MSEATHSPEIAQLLSRMRDIHQADPIGLWPLAPGWWVLIVLVIVLILCTGIAVFRHLKSTRWRKYACMELRQLKTRYHQLEANSRDSQQTLAEINQLVRRVYARKEGSMEALSYPPNDWLETLRQVFPNTDDEDLQKMAVLHYSPNCAPISTETLAILEQWVKRR